MPTFVNAVVAKDYLLRWILVTRPTEWPTPKICDENNHNAILSAWYMLSTVLSRNTYWYRTIISWRRKSIYWNLPISEHHCLISKIDFVTSGKRRNGFVKEEQRFGIYWVDIQMVLIGITINYTHVYTLIDSDKCTCKWWYKKIDSTKANTIN